MTVCVVALGKIGLPLALQFASKGFKVIGADVNQGTVDLVNAAQEPFPGEHSLAERLTKAISGGQLRATTDTTAAVSESDVVVVVVPLIVDDDANPEFRALDAATSAIARGLKPGTLVCYETTLPVGTTRDRFVPALEQGSGLRVGQDFHVVFSPERVFSGRIFADLRKYPKLVGGVDEASEQRGVDFYAKALDFDDRPDLHMPNGVWRMGSSEAAEFAKLAETTYRDLNIALANQFTKFADTIGVDVRTVIEASNSQPFSHIHLPGIAVGGHCIPVYPRFYLTNDPSAQLVAEGRAVNDSMPQYAVTKLTESMGGSLNGKTVAVLGACYRGGVKETAFSGVFATVRAVVSAGGNAVVHDPLYTDDELEAFGFAPYHLGEPCDAAVVHTDHVEYRSIGPTDFPGIRALVDGRRITNRQAFETAQVAWTSVG